MANYGEGGAEVPSVPFVASVEPVENVSTLKKSSVGHGCTVTFC